MIYLIDKEDAELCGRYSWAKQKGGYASASTRDGKTVLLHRLILKDQLNDSDVVDHINGNPYDNRKANLRICTVGQNCMNCKDRDGRTGIKGVFLDNRAKSKKYRARIGLNGKQIHLGAFATLEEAINARRKAEIELYGDYAPSKCREGGGYEAWED